MPTYAYACRDCQHAFEIQQSFSDDSLTTCPECEGALRKQFNSVGIVFKGSGFYRTDSRDKKSASTTAAKPAEPKSDSSTSESSKSESKPAASETKKSGSSPASKVAAVS